MSDKPVKDYDKFVVRLPEGMRDALAERAKRNGRSMNSEVVQILQDSLISGIYDMVITKENLEKMPEDVRKNLIINRTAQARIKMNESLREIEENLELLGINGDDTLGDVATKWWKNHDARTIETISKKRWNKKPT